MSKFSSRFNFVGKAMIPRATSKRQMIQFYKDNTVASLFFGVRESDNNLAFVEAVGSIQDEILTMTTGNEKIAVPWDTRHDRDVVSSIANYRKFVVDLGEDHGGRCEFISAYDMILHLAEHLPNIKDRVIVTGSFTKDWYKERFVDRFSVQNVFLAPEDKKNRLGLSVDVFYNKDSIDKSEYGDTHKLYVNGYVPQYVKDRGTLYFPHQFVLDTEKYDKNDPGDQGIMTYKLEFLDVSGTSMVHIPWEVSLIRGAEEVPFDESMLTPAQLRQVKLGLKSVDDFRPRGQVLGENIVEYRLDLPILRGDSSEGLIDMDMQPDEFERLVYSPNAAPADTPLNVSEDDLFA